MRSRWLFPRSCLQPLKIIITLKGPGILCAFPAPEETVHQEGEQNSSVSGGCAKRLSQHICCSQWRLVYADLFLLSASPRLPGCFQFGVVAVVVKVLRGGCRAWDLQGMVVCPLECSMCWKDSYVHQKAHFKTLPMTYAHVWARLAVSGSSAFAASFLHLSGTGPWVALQAGPHAMLTAMVDLAAVVKPAGIARKQYCENTLGGSLLCQSRMGLYPLLRYS